MAVEYLCLNYRTSSRRSGRAGSLAGRNAVRRRKIQCISFGLKRGIL
jgi:hypothetical protein